MRVRERGTSRARERALGKRWASTPPGATRTSRTRTGSRGAWHGCVHLSHAQCVRVDKGRPIGRSHGAVRPQQRHAVMARRRVLRTANQRRPGGRGLHAHLIRRPSAHATATAANAAAAADAAAHTAAHARAATAGMASRRVTGCGTQAKGGCRRGGLGTHHLPLRGRRRVRQQPLGWHRADLMPCAAHAARHAAGAGTGLRAATAARTDAALPGRARPHAESHAHAATACGAPHGDGRGGLVWP